MNRATIEHARGVSIESELVRRGHKLAGRNERFGPCPVCGGTDRFSINLKKQLWNCRGCDRGGDVIDLVRHIDDCGFIEAVALLTGEGARQQIRTPRAQPVADKSDTDTIDIAARIWKEANAIEGTIGAIYFEFERGISEFPPDCAGSLRFHPQCTWGGERKPCILALFRDVVTKKPTGIHRIALSAAGELIGRKALGRKQGCAVKLWPDAEVTTGLVVGEGIETTLAAASRVQHRGTMLQPAWALVDAQNLSSFPVLNGIEAITILADADEIKQNGKQPGQDAARACAQRWANAGREATILTPDQLGKDFNDVAREQP
jgi:phage/plasmid primase-like uncharacterized protein